MENTLQSALKELFYSMGGNAADVRDVSDVNKIILAIAALNIGAEVKTALVKELPDWPDDDGTYSLQLVMADGEAALTWEAVTE